MEGVEGHQGEHEAGHHLLNVGLRTWMHGHALGNEPNQKRNLRDSFQWQTGHEGKRGHIIETDV